MNVFTKTYYRLTAWTVSKSYKERGWVLIKYASFLHNTTVLYGAGKCTGDFETCPDQSCIDIRNHRQWLKERYLWIEPSLNMSSRITRFMKASKRFWKKGSPAAV